MTHFRSACSAPPEEDDTGAPGAPDARRLPAPVPSPCVSVCRMNPHTGLCEGCLRTIDEIAAWSTLDDDGKRAVWRQLELRRAAPTSR